MMILTEVILNRLRGTGDIVNIGRFTITGTMLYALYLELIIGFMFEWYYGLLTLLLFLLGESYAWGTWVSYLCYPKNHPKEYDSKVGRGFPFIHYVANYIIPQLQDYKKYCQIALTIRGFYWWLPIYLLFAYIGMINYLEAVIFSIILGVGFPFACYIGSIWEYEKSFGILQFKKGWENQEIIYGLIQGLVFWSSILIYLTRYQG